MSAARLVTCTFTATTHTTDHDVVEEEDPQDQPQLALNSDDEEENGPGEHLLSKAEVTLRRLVRAIVEKMAAGEEIVVWKVVPPLATNTRKERPANFREKEVGLKAELRRLKMATWTCSTYGYTSTPEKSRTIYAA
jgi:hypothetical protein